MKLQRIFFLILVLLSAVQIAHFYPLMPGRMASHYNAAGKANGWMPRDGFFVVYLLLLGLMSVMFHLMPKGMLKFPDSMINLPNKAYWLSPGHRAETGAIIEQYMAAAGNATIAFLLVVFHLVFSANLEQGGRLPDWMMLLVAGFVVVLAGWSIAFIRAFNLPPGAKAP